jgi:serine/threonine protein kinase
MSEPAINGPTPRDSARYQVIAKLGQGGMARVLLMLSQGRGGVKKLLVTKELLPELKEDPDFVTMFLDEARIALRLNHPNVIQTYEVSSEGEYPRIVMEYLEGQTLAVFVQRVGRTKLPIAVHLHMLTEALAGLHHAHELCDFDGTHFGVVHRDVSPQNVFVTYDGQVKIVDFGIAKATCTDRTRTGIFKGKANYAAPEQMICGAIDRRTDIFSIGAMLWEALARQRLAGDIPEIAMMQRRVSGQDPPIRSVAPDTPEEIARICDKAMAPESCDRYATADEMRADIMAYLETSRPRGARELSELMCSVFANERAKIRQQIDVRVKEISSAEATAETVFEASSPASDELPSIGTHSRTALLNDPPRLPEEGAARSVAPPRPPLLVIAIGLGLACAVGVAASLLFRAPRAEPVAAVDASPVIAPQPPPDPTAAASLVDVTISVSPPEARAFLDDVPFATNPFHGKLPRSAQSHIVRCSAPGFATDERHVTFEADLQIQVQLKSAAPVPDPASRAPWRFVPAPARPAPRDPAPKATTPPSAPAAPSTPAAPSPGDAIGPGARKKPRSIDDKF